MQQSSLALDIGFLDNLRKTSRRYHTHKQSELVLFPAEIPKILLIDEDRAFVEAFASLAMKFRVPFQSFRSTAGLETRRTWDYDLVLLDARTVGKDNVLETAIMMANVRGDLSIVLIGDTEPSEKEMGDWTGLIDAFLYKDWDAEHLFNEALRIYSKDLRRPTRKRIKLFGGFNGHS